MTISRDDADWMRRALALAEAGRATTHPNPRVGCVLVRDGQAVGEGAHLRAGEPHAEVHALRAAGEQARGATAYVTLEPCNHHGRTPPCTEALIAAGVARVVVAVEDPNPQVAGQGLARLRAAGIAVDCGVSAETAEAINRGFFSRMRRGRPWVSLKWAASLDGRTALADGQSQWITGETARADVHRRRAEAGAVLVGADTVLADDPRLDVRLPDFGHRRPDRWVLDRRARVPATATVWREDGARRYWITCEPGPAPTGVTRVVLAGEAPCFPALWEAMAAEGVNEVLVEAGAQLGGALIAEEAVDEVLLYLAPCLLGDDARGLARLPALKALAEAPRLQFTEATPVGADLRLTLVPLRRS